MITAFLFETQPAAVPTTVYGLIYASIMAFLGGGAFTLYRVYRGWLTDKVQGKKDKVASLEEWIQDLIDEGEYKTDIAQWTDELNGRYAYLINSHPSLGPEVTAKVRDSMWPRPKRKVEKEGSDDGPAN